MSHYNSLITVLILTKDEKIHIRRCVESAKKLTPNVIVVDSNSTDGTVDIATNMGAEVINGDFNSFSDKLNWCLSNIDFKTKWVFRLDADEILTTELISNLEDLVQNLADDVTGVYINRQLCFMGSKLRFGGLNSNFSIRLWKNKAVICEVRALDEHLILKFGRSVKFNLNIVDDPLTDLSNWINKHNRYSTLEALSALQKETSVDSLKPDFWGDGANRKRWMKLILYNNLPLFVRPFLYFLYRYILLLGFLDGMPGFLFFFFYSFWYRILVDSKIREIKKNRINQ